jgi:tol-pal system protein YbgF
MKHSFFLIIGLMALLQGCATSSDLYNLEDRMNYTIRDQDAARRAEFEKMITERMSEGRQLRDQSAALGANMDQFREEIQKLRGEIDESEYQSKNRLQALETKLQAVTERLDRLDSGGGQNSANSSMNSPSAGTPERSPELSELSEKSEAELYGEGKRAFDNNQTESAKKIFQVFLEKYPKSPEADNAQFWLAESFFRDKWYEKAILEYQKVIENYPKGNKVTDSLWKQGLAFLNYGDKANARLIWETLVKKFPGSPQAQMASQKLKSL